MHTAYSDIFKATIQREHIFQFPFSMTTMITIRRTKLMDKNAAKFMLGF
jgi:hypothetical protein